MLNLYREIILVLQGFLVLNILISSFSHEVYNGEGASRDTEHHLECCFFLFECYVVIIFICHSSQAGFSADGAGESALPAEESPSAGSANSENFTRK